MNSIDRPSWFPKSVWNFLFTYKDEYKPSVVIDELKMTERDYNPQHVQFIKNIPKNILIKNDYMKHKEEPVKSINRPSRTKDYARKSVQTIPRQVRKVQEESHIDYSRNDSSNDLVTGMIIGSLINSQNTRQEEISTPVFESGNGGDFGGGGASGSWDNEPTKIDTCSDSSSSDSSSSDSSSY